jgi:hypothetical protein
MTTTPRPYLDPQAGENAPKKEVSAKAMSRLTVAADAIAATKKAIPAQGNQVPALQSTKMNSNYRLKVMRDDDCWEFATTESATIAGQHREAFEAAKADLAHGGNCGEHAWVAYHYLRLHAKGQQIQYSARSGLDHAFVILGDLKSDKDSDLAVSDPWPNNPTACLWEDHFAFAADRTQIADYTHMVADGKSFKAAIAAGLRLSAKGQALVAKADSQADTDQKTSDYQANHFWNQPDTVATGHKFQYTTPAAQQQQQPQQQP